MMFCELWENSRKRRTRFQIIENILRAARNGIYKTQIMQEAGLSHTQLSGYLSLLMKVGLLKTIKKNDRVGYKITSKGIILKVMKNQGFVKKGQQTRRCILLQKDLREDGGF